MTALDRLIEAVEAGDFPAGSLGAARAVFPYIEPPGIDLGLFAREAFDGSLDAAKALYKALLPGLRVDIGGPIADGAWCATIAQHDTIFHATPARAWLLAILCAYRTSQGETE